MKALLLTVGLAGAAFLAGRSLYGSATSNGPAPTISYFSDGQKKTSMTYVDGVRQGLCEEWHANGQAGARGEYRDGLREGAWSFWNEDGSVDAARSGEYRGGRRIEDSLEGSAG